MLPQLVTARATAGVLTLLLLTGTTGCSLFRGSKEAAASSTAASTTTAPKKITPESTVACLNVENLFDFEDDQKTNDDDFTPTGRQQWTQERYETKLRNLASVISDIGGPDGPDVIGLNETENKRVLEDLVKEPLIADRHYQIAHSDSPDPRGIDCPLLYKPERFTLTRQREVPLVLPDTTMGTRGLFVVEGLLDQQPITFMVAHWPSRRGGEKALRRRMSAAKQCRQVIDGYLKTNPQARIVLMGNLNDTPLDESVTTSLGSSGELLNRPAAQLYNAFYDLQTQGKGTMHFRSRPDVFDQMLLSDGLITGSGLHFVAGSATIHNPERLTNPQTKFPGESLGTFVGRKYIGGYSDHFAVFVKLTTAPAEKRAAGGATNARPAAGR